LKNPVFQGACTALITPFTEDGPDLERMKQHLEAQEAAGTAAVLIAGTTGESATLRDEEYYRLAAFCVRQTGGKMKTILGIGGNDSEKCLQYARFAQSIGADAVLMSTPYYNKTTQPGLVRHFFHVADKISLPMILYNIPGRTSIGISAETYRLLSEHPNINGVKEASGDFSLIARVRSECGDDLNFWCGNDDQTIPMMAMGAQGVISVLSNLAPKAVSELFRLCSEGNYLQATALYQKYAKLCRLLFAETNPIPVKAAMALTGADSGLLRLPLISASEQTMAGLKKCLGELGLLPA